jgi:hypothetical protein
LIASESEKQKLRDLVDTNQNFAETVTELLMYYDQLVHELKESNPALSLRIMNKVSDIMERRILT